MVQTVFKKVALAIFWREARREQGSLATAAVIQDRVENGLGLERNCWRWEIFKEAEMAAFTESDRKEEGRE